MVYFSELASILLAKFALNLLTPAPTLTTTNTAINTWVARMMVGYWKFHSKGEVCLD
jgi:hypothetical protein